MKKRTMLLVGGLFISLYGVFGIRFLSDASGWIFLAMGMGLLTIGAFSKEKK